MLIKIFSFRSVAVNSDIHKDNGGEMFPGVSAITFTLLQYSHTGRALNIG